MKQRSVGRPKTLTPDQKREAARERQQERRRRLAADGGRSITLAVPGDLLATLDEEAKRRGISRSELLITCARTQIHGSEPQPANSELNPDPTAAEIRGPQYRGRALLLAGAVGVVLGSWFTLLIN